eukprot:NODE_320_length_11094_cov_0.618190.p2 type:complete len:412 gc:universal NODE_320_length_11094_cov_0.618190:8730-7495(-)
MKNFTLHIALLKQSSFLRQKNTKVTCNHCDLVLDSNDSMGIYNHFLANCDRSDEERAEIKKLLQTATKPVMDIPVENKRPGRPRKHFPQSPSKKRKLEVREVLMSPWKTAAQEFGSFYDNAGNGSFECAKCSAVLVSVKTGVHYHLKSGCHGMTVVERQHYLSLLRTATNPDKLQDLPPPPPAPVHEHHKKKKEKIFDSYLFNHGSKVYECGEEFFECSKCNSLIPIDHSEAVFHLSSCLSDFDFKTLMSFMNEKYGTTKTSTQRKRKDKSKDSSSSSVAHLMYKKPSTPSIPNTTVSRDAFVSLDDADEDSMDSLTNSLNNPSSLSTPVVEAQPDLPVEDFQAKSILLDNLSDEIIFKRMGITKVPDEIVHLRTELTKHEKYKVTQVATIMNFLKDMDSELVKYYLQIIK